MVRGHAIEMITFLLAIALIIIAIPISGCISGTTGSGNRQVIYGPDDSSSAAGWTMKGASLDFSGKGNPVPAYKTNKGEYMYKELDLVPGSTIEFDAYLDNRRDQLGTFYFLCDETGKGNGVVLEGREDYHATSFVRTYNWTISDYSENSEFSVPIEQWVHVKIIIGESTANLYIDYKDAKGNLYTFTEKNWTFDNKGKYVGFNGDGGLPHTVWWDNLVVSKP